MQVKAVYFIGLNERLFALRVYTLYYSKLFVGCCEELLPRNTEVIASHW
jgi:hypothetical protein